MSQEHQHEETRQEGFFGKYRKCCRLARASSRGRNPAWYQDVSSLGHQIHFYEVGNQYFAFYFNVSAGTWVTVSPVSSTADDEALQQYLDYIRSEVLPPKTKSLGFMIHLNQEVSVFEFPLSHWEDEGGVAAVRDLIHTDPGQVLQDRTLSADKNSFRVYPTPASPSVETTGCAIATATRGEDFLKRLRDLGVEANFPIRTLGLCSPLLLMARLPRTFGNQDKPFCTMLRFEDFSFFGFFTGAGELILLRSVRNTNKKLPHNLESNLLASAAAVEISELEVKAFDCRIQQEESLEDELSGILFNCVFQTFVPPTQSEITLPPELSVFQIEDSNEGLSFSETETFGQTIDDNYHLQDFLPPSSVEVEALPSGFDMKLFRLGRLMKFAGGLAVMSFMAWTFLGILKVRKNADFSQEIQSVPDIAALTQKLGKLRSTESYLIPRSRAWVNMELISQMFENDGSVMLSEVEHTAAPARGGLATAKSPIEKTWTISGLANTQALSRFDTLNTQEGMKEVFKRASEVTNDESLDPSPNSRNLFIVLELDRRSSEVALSDGSTRYFTHKFTIKIRQTFSAADKIALPKNKI